MVSLVLPQHFNTLDLPLDAPLVPPMLSPTGRPSLDRAPYYKTGQALGTWLGQLTRQLLIQMLGRKKTARRQLK